MELDARDCPDGDDEEIAEQHLTDEEDYSWPDFCQSCGFAVLDCVCEHDDRCPTCGDDIADCACALERRRRREERVLERLYHS